MLRSGQSKQFIQKVENINVCAECGLEGTNWGSWPAKLIGLLS